MNLESAAIWLAERFPATVKRRMWISPTPEYADSIFVSATEAGVKFEHDEPDGTLCRDFVWNSSIRRAEIDRMRRRVRHSRFRLMSHRGTEICVALQSANFPALITLEIIDRAIPHATYATMFHKWELITAVKHFHDRRKDE